ncbi:LysR family transcriptional regulator [Halomonas sp. MCCC 1A17488]|uniref:LysR family transcriptional regulator n=1 Tax=unclassified Halomonas TaxID=2609666 RepID=UPI0018D23FB3|nr:MULTISPECIES: LysR family transcriptional regulator [unclassified Halomonas]MCE8017718.1 LysR family transcriptional regulator [Halomonas sp. MCCC 1A17488]MCG3241051.1 LysR family transcriptional regulator [Halomonas sp. MCCC 1A17488]QPP48914.1 LysR family transcriptional regulator [Halomonas sp. SS10-MC5]
MLRLPSLIALHYFEVAARTKSFAAAAKELNVTPAAISHQIKALEEYLGVDLFIRHHRRVSLTPAARLALPELQDGFQALGRGVEKIRSYGEERLIVTVCAEPLFATKWIVPRLHRFYARCPDAEVRLQASLHTVDRSRDSAFGVADLKRAGIDVSVRLGYGNYAELEPLRLMSLDLVPLCAPELAAAVDDLDTLRRLPLLCDSTLTRFNEPYGWKEWFKQQGCDIGALRELRFGNGLLALEAAIAGQGALLGSRQLHQAELRAGKLTVLADRPLSSDQAYYVVSAGAGLERPIAGQFREWLVDEAGIR